MDKINEMSTGEKLIAGGGVLMLIASFLNWWHASIGPISVGQSGWDAPGSLWGILAILLSIVLAGIVIAWRLGNVAMPALPENVTWGIVFGGGAALVVVFMLLKAWRITAAPVGGFGIGFFLGLIAAVCIAAGGYLLYSEEKKGAVTS
jgi:hypothetical protein